MDMEQSFFDEEHIKHLMEIDGIADPMHQLGELKQVMHQLSGKAARRQEKVKKHMNQCGVCLSKMMEAGQLLPIEDYWKLGPMIGKGRLPKLHYLTN